jgi:hypothetical protein
MSLLGGTRDRQESMRDDLLTSIFAGMVAAYTILGNGPFFALHGNPFRFKA